MVQIYPGEAKETVKSFFGEYLCSRNVEGTLRYLSEHIQWVGTGRDEVALSKEEAKASLEKEVGQDSAPYDLVFKRVQEQIVSQQCGIVFCEILVSRDDAALEARVTAACQKEPDGVKIVTIHASVATSLQEEGEFFPIQFLEKAKEEFERQITERSFDLLNKSLSGGIMGGYIEEGFPLYYINEHMLEHLGYTYEEFVEDNQGLVINCMHPDDRHAVDEKVMEAFAQNREYKVRYRMRRKDGSYIWVNDIGRKSIADNGRKVCLSVICDVTNEIEMNRLLLSEVAEKEAQAEKYNSLFQSVLCGIVQYRVLEDGRVQFKNANREAIRIFGYEPEDFWDVKNWVLDDFTAPEFLDEIRDDLTRLKSEGGQNSYEYQLIKKDGRRCWIIGNATHITDSDGEELIQSVFLDIDKSKKAEIENQMLSERVEAGNTLLKMALEGTDTCEFYYYPAERLGIIPERTADLIHCSRRYENMPEDFCSDMVEGQWQNSFLEMFKKIEAGEKTARAEFKVKDSDLWCRIVMSGITYDANGAITFAVGMIDDITKEKSMETALEEERNKDRLTGLYTREAGIRKVREYMEGPHTVSALMLLDMDGFYEINAREGNVFADAVLQEVAEVLRQETRKGDILVRLGGDEFMVFVKDCDKSRATILGPAIAEKIKGLFLGKEADIKISASIGMCASSVVDEYSGLYRCAESTLHYVKENGKGAAACYLDTSNELGTVLTQIYTQQYLFNEIEGQAQYREDDFIAFALELLGKAKKLDDAIYLLLARVGKHYGLDRITITEVDPEYRSVAYKHQWATKQEYFFKGQMLYLKQEEYEFMLQMYDNDGVFEHCDANRYKLNSSIQIGIWNLGEYTGAISYESDKKEYVFTKEQKKLLKELTKLISSFVMKARSDAISQAKTDFLSRMSHEIRTPMNAISGMTTIAKTVTDDRGKLLDCLNKIEKANSYLLNLINDILDMSRIESGKMELNFESMDLREQMDNLYGLLCPQAQDKGITLVFQNSYEENRLLWADVLRLNQVLINIIGNAIKFTKNGGSVSVSAEPVETEAEQVKIRFAVKDTGIGISKEALGHIFNAFEQAQKTTSAEYGGTGLGLSISSRLVQMMGGTIEAESEEGVGSEFYFTLSFRYSNHAVQEQGDKGPAKKRRKRPNFAKRRLLIAEDNDLNLEIVQTLMEMEGFQTEEAVNGREAVDMFLSHEPFYYDAILMDIRMPVMDGLEATKKIRTLEREDSGIIPIIAMTANAFDEDTRRSLECGMNGHLTKPIVMEDLMCMLEKCLTQK